MPKISDVSAAVSPRAWQSGEGTDRIDKENGGLNFGNDMTSQIMNVSFKAVEQKELKPSLDMLT